jgi:glutamine cyclotransferase
MWNDRFIGGEWRLDDARASSAEANACGAWHGASAPSPPAPVYGYRVVASAPHDPHAFTQGLVYWHGELYESTGLHGRSSLRRVDVETGRVLQKVNLPVQYFGEGLALVGDRIVQLTWKQGLAFVYDRRTFERLGAFAYQAEGWGLAYDESRGLIMSDGSERLSFRHPATFEVTRTLQVESRGRPVSRLNDLACVEGEIWANIWRTNRIARISAETGSVVGWINLETLWPVAERTPDADVLNGIAYDPERGRVFVTGKNWPTLYEIAITCP